VDPAAGATRAVCQRLIQGCGSTLEKSKTRLRLFSPGQAPRWKGRVSSFPTRYPAPSESNHEAVRTPDLESRSPTLFLGRAWLTGDGERTNKRTCRGTTSTSAPAPSETSSPATYVACRWKRRASSLTCYPRPCARPAACGHYPRHHRPHAHRHASAGGGRATPAAAVHHDGREDALRGQRAVPRGTARAAAPAQGAGGGAGAAGERRVLTSRRRARWTTSTAGRRTARATHACVSRCRVTSSARC
jgi:hypothetical protein